MNAYIIVTGDLVEHGGMDRANLEFARYVAARGHPLHVIAHRISRSIADLPGVQCHYVPRPFRFGIIGERGLDFYGRRLARRLPQGTRVLVNGGNCAVDAVNWMHYVHRAEPPADDKDSLRKRSIRTLATWSEARAVGKARLIIANSKKTEADVVSNFGLLSVPIHTVYCGLDPSRFSPVGRAERASIAARLGFREDRLRLVFVGALGDERKGFGTLFDAWRTLAPRWRDAEVLVVGDGRLRASLIERTQTANLSDRLHFLGVREDVAEILKCSDVLVAPARYEPYGLCIAEALATGLSVVATKNSGATELMAGTLRELLLTDPSSADELLRKLGLWRDSRERYQEAARDASVEVRRHSWQDMCSEIYQLVERAYA